MRRSSCLVAPSLIVAACLVATGLLVAQSPTPVFRAGVELVPVDVVVTDAHDQPINDLTAADFTLTDSGRRQTIATFQHLSIPVEHRVVDVHQPPAPSPDVATNAPSAPSSRVWVMIIDDQHLIEHDITHVKQVIGDFLRALPPDDEIAMVFVSRSDLSINFTNDSTRLLRALDGVRGAFGFGLDAAGTDPTGKRLKGEPFARARTSIYALTNAIGALAGSSHVRRAIVYVSAFSIIPPPIPGCADCVALQGELDDAYELARRADVPIYTLDPRGIPRPPTAVRAPVGAFNPGIQRNIEVQEDHLKEIAERTGGRAFVHQDDLTKEVNDLVADNGSLYVLGFTPTPVVHDGKFHDIHVTVNRPGARVRARAGYMAASATVVPANTQQTLDQAMGRGVDVSALTLRAFAAPVAAAAKGGMSTVLTVDVTYPASDSLPTELDDDLKVDVMALDPDAKIKASTTHDWHVTGRPALDHTLTVRLDERLDLPSQPLTIRIGVASSMAGRAGTIQFPLDVPNPKSGKIQIGAVVLGLLTAESGLVAGFDTVQPLVPFQPTTTRTFTLADTLRIYAPIFWSTKDGAADVTVLVSGVHSAPVVHATLSARAGPSGRSEAAMDATIPLKDLSPGPCTVSVTAHVASGALASRVIPCAIEIPK